MARHSPSPLLTSNPRPSTPPTPHRGQSNHQDNHISSPMTSVLTNNATNNNGSGIFSNSLPMQMHSLQQQQQQMSGSSHATGGISWAASPSSGLIHPSPSSSTSQHQQVQWGSTPSLLPASIQWGSTGSCSTAAPSNSHNTASPLASSSSTNHNNDPFLSASSSPYAPPDRTRKSEIKRKRLQDEDEDEEMGGPVAVAIRSSPDRSGGVEGTHRVLAGQSRNLVPKRLRAGLGGVFGLEESIGLGSSDGPVAGANSRDRGTSCEGAVSKGVDLGKMLASLDKPNLLSLLTSLLAQHPQIADSIYALLPLPTLESVNQSLDAYEAAIKSALPFAAHPVRPEYTWNRLRGPVGELVSGVQGWMDFFHAKEEKEIEAGGVVHPSTMFSLLHTITARSIKITRGLPAVPSQWISGASSLRSMNGDDNRASASSRNTSKSQRTLLSALPPGILSPSNPNGMVTTLLPLLLGAWDGLLGRITHDLNGQGKMFGREVVVSWLRGVESLASGDVSSCERGEDDEQRMEVLRAVQEALKGVEADFKTEVGWVVGVF